MKRRLECVICGTQREVDGRCRIRTCRRCQGMTPHAEIGFVCSDGTFFGYRNLADLLELVLAEPEQRAHEWETELASRREEEGVAVNE